MTEEKERQGEEEEDGHLLQEFDEEIADLSMPTAKIEEIKEEMQKQFDNIIDEVQKKEMRCELNQIRYSYFPLFSRYGSFYLSYG